MPLPSSTISAPVLTYHQMPNEYDVADALHDLFDSKEEAPATEIRFENGREKQVINLSLQPVEPEHPTKGALKLVIESKTSNVPDGHPFVLNTVYSLLDELNQTNLLAPRKESAATDRVPFSYGFVLIEKPDTFKEKLAEKMTQLEQEEDMKLSCVRRSQNPSLSSLSKQNTR